MAERVPAVETEEPYNEHFATEQEARFAWALLNLCLRGPNPHAWPEFPGDRQGRKPETTGYGEAKGKVRLEEYAEQVVALHPAGGNKLKALCPLHVEHTPSFIVFTDSQRWRCFGACATGGDVYDLERALRQRGKRAPALPKVAPVRRGVDL